MLKNQFLACDSFSSRRWGSVAKSRDFPAAHRCTRAHNASKHDVFYRVADFGLRVQNSSLCHRGLPVYFLLLSGECHPRSQRQVLTRR